MMCNVPTEQLAKLLPDVTQLRLHGSVSGGCTSQAFRATGLLDDGRNVDFIVKQNDASFLDNFMAEANGLSALATIANQVDELIVPTPISPVEIEDHAYLVMPWIESAETSVLQERYGQALAKFHRAGSRDEIGYPINNYLGSAIQNNTPTNTWVDFVAENRLGYQLRWAADEKRTSSRLTREVEAIIDRLDDLLEGRLDQTSLLHGDLWSGNVIFTSNHQIALIDPAVHFGCPEAELGMIRLFGGVGSEFYEGYNSIARLPDGWRRRCDVYKLVHLLNHLNLFGGSYLQQCEEVATSIMMGR